MRYLALLVFLCSTLAAFALATDEPVTPPTPVPTTRTAKFVIALAGDSTVNDGGGWGKGFAADLKPDAQCLNFAQNGRSSKSFRAEGWWKKLIAAKPDVVLIQFGHNDQPGKGPERETDPQTTYKELMGQYIDEARAIGATPILVTSLSRRAWGDDGKIHSTLTPYVDAVKELGKARNVPVIDLHALSIAKYEELGKAACEDFSARDKAGKVDNTHLAAKGGQLFGHIVAEELKKTLPAAAPYIK